MTSRLARRWTNGRALALAGLVLLVGACDGGGADPVPPPAPPHDVPAPATGAAEDAARAAFQDVATTRGAYHEAAQRAKDDPALQPAMAAARDAYTDANNAFRDAFLAADWNAFDPARDRAVLEHGLAVGARHLLERDPRRSIEAFNRIIDTMPQSGVARMARASVPFAYVEAGDLEGALERIDSMTDGLAGAELANLLITKGDLQAALGSRVDARATYGAAAAAVAGPLDDARDPRLRSRRDAQMRLHLLGRPAPEIDSDTWLGGTPRPLSALRGKVVVIDFWATWCPPCHPALPRLDEIHARYRSSGVEVLGVTRFYANGFLPESRAAVLSGESVTGMTEPQFLPHLRKYRERLGIGYPFVVGRKADFDRYRVASLPTLVIVDRAGTIAFVKMGGGSGKLVAAALERLLR